MSESGRDDDKYNVAETISDLLQKEFGYSGETDDQRLNHNIGTNLGNLGLQVDMWKKVRVSGDKIVELIDEATKTLRAWYPEDKLKERLEIVLKEKETRGEEVEGTVFKEVLDRLNASTPDKSEG